MARSARFAGVDGCPSGWVYAAGPGRLQIGVAASFAALVDGPLSDCAAVCVDMPIGLATSGRRSCESEARRALGPRRSSVFPSPRRAMLDFDAYADANAWGKANDPAAGGLSRQAWHIIPKIREVDAVMTPALQARICEAHPEAAFARLAGRPCDHAKRTPQGAIERRAILAANGVDPSAALADLRKRHPRRKDVADDDLFDACVLAMTARARLAGRAVRYTDGARDARGLVMEIWC